MMEILSRQGISEADWPVEFAMWRDVQLLDSGKGSSTCFSHLGLQHGSTPSSTSWTTNSGLVSHFHSYLPEIPSPPPYQVMSE